jgi:hypothetical protein
MNPFVNFSIRGVLSVFLAFGFLFSARALTINVTYDASVTNIGTLAQVQTAFGAAVQTIQNLYTNAITINIKVYSAYAGPFGYVDLGESQTEFVGNPTYSQLTNALAASRTSVADSNSVASLPANPAETNLWWIPRAEAKALGMSALIATNATNADGEIGFATTVNYTFDPNNRAVSGEYDFIGVAEHEITEVLGRSRGLNFFITGYIPYDLFRFTAAGVRSFDPNAATAYFSIDNGLTVLKHFNPSGNGGDIQDWTDSTPPDSFDAFVYDGEELTLSAADLTAVDILGFKLNYQLPHLNANNAGGGNFQLNFTNTPGTSYAILASTNVSLSVSNWTALGQTTETSAGQFKFSDSTTNKLRFYRVRLN